MHQWSCCAQRPTINTVTASTRSNPDGTALLSLTAESLTELLSDWGQPRFRAKQILEWVYARGATTYEQMTNLPKELRSRLTAELPFFESTIVQRQDSRDGTVKLLLRWPDGSTSECVMIPDDDRRTACISTQVGCPVGCHFCASGIGGLERQLTAGQVVEQALRIRQICEQQQARLSNVVFMGLGEPLANYDTTIRAVRTINADWGLNIGARKITVSTVGLPTPMRKLADEGLQVTLALSLHAPNDEVRRRIIPWAQNISLNELVEAGRYYFDLTGREITIEYILLAGVNDQPQHATELAGITRRMRSNVNLIQYNPVEGLPFDRPTSDAAHDFLHRLRDLGVNAHLRRSRGLDIDGACGQLRRREDDAQSRLTAIEVEGG